MLLEAGGNMIRPAVVISAVFCYPIWLLYQTYRQTGLRRKKKDANCLDEAMTQKYWELCDDPAMTEAKWREWLPVFEYADREVLSINPHQALGRNAQRVRAKIRSGSDRASP